MKIFDTDTQILLTKSLDVTSLRNEIIADNIANVDTPNFKRREIVFSKKLQAVLEKLDTYDELPLKKSNNRHFSLEADNNSLINCHPEIVEMKNTRYRNDNNNVDIDVEMAESTKNKLNYDLLSECMNHELKLLRLAITGRG